MTNKVLTASRQVALLSCPRRHYWQYEVGLREDQPVIALRFGSAWARAMEARWDGREYEDALSAAIPEGCDLDPYSVAKIAALLIGYYRYWGQRETCAKMHPEEQFCFQLEDHPLFGDWTVAGKLDAIGTLAESGVHAILESKTTSAKLDPDSQYWQRLRFNVQILQYVDAARRSGWEIVTVLYDVTRKPAIKPREVICKDELGPIVLDAAGKRALKKDGKPRATADKKKGFAAVKRSETPKEYGDRLAEDVEERPEFYFARREVPVMDSEVRMLQRHRLALVGMIEHLRGQEDPAVGACEAWPRNVGDSCKFCQYQSFCLSNQLVRDPVGRPPHGFSVQPFNPELESETDATADPEDDDSSA